jgi:hypothetical protein
MKDLNAELTPSPSFEPMVKNYANALQRETLSPMQAAL